MRGALFDLDGTLADTAPDLVGALNDGLTHWGLPTVPYEAARRTAGAGGRALIALGYRSAGVALNAADLEARIPEFLELYAARLTRESRLFDGALDAVDALAADGWRIGVCTNKPHDLAVRFLEELGVANRFHAIVGAGAEGLSARKPDARHVSVTATRAGAAPARSVLVGDTITDRDAARNAGTPVVLATFGYALQSLDDLAPDAVFDAFAALPPMLNALVPA